MEYVLFQEEFKGADNLEKRCVVEELIMKVLCMYHLVQLEKGIFVLNWAPTHNFLSHNLYSLQNYPNNCDFNFFFQMEKGWCHLKPASARVIYSAWYNGAAVAEVSELEWVPETKQAPLELFPTCQGYTLRLQRKTCAAMTPAEPSQGVEGMVLHLPSTPVTGIKLTLCFKEWGSY